MHKKIHKKLDQKLKSQAILSQYQPKESMQFVPASLIKRLGAMLYDSLIIISLLMITTALWLPFNHGDAILSDHILYWPMQFSYVFVFFCFFCFFWWRDGQTIGMRAWHIRVQNLNGKNLSIIQSIQRLLAASVSFAVFGLGYFYALTNPTKQTWHDKWTQTEIVMDKITLKE